MLYAVETRLIRQPLWNENKQKKLEKKYEEMWYSSKKETRLKSHS